MSPSEALGRLAVKLVNGDPEHSSLSLVRLFPKLGLHLERAGGVLDVTSVTTGQVRAWVDAPLAGGGRPSVATRHVRRAAARLAFRLLRSSGVVSHDPTTDIRLPPRRAGRTVRPLTEEEVSGGRAASLRTLGDARVAALWALAEATATTTEIAHVLPRHVDLDGGTVLLAGSSRLDPRQGRLTDWGAAVLARHLAKVPDSPIPLVSGGGSRSSESLRTAVISGLVRVLVDIGLGDDQTVKSSSVRAWAGRRVLMESGRLDEAALALGCRTLDTAAAIVGFEWREPR